MVGEGPSAPHLDARVVIQAQVQQRGAEGRVAQQRQQQQPGGCLHLPELQRHGSCHPEEHCGQGMHGSLRWRATLTPQSLSTWEQVSFIHTDPRCTRRCCTNRSSAHPVAIAQSHCLCWRPLWCLEGQPWQVFTCGVQRGKQLLPALEGGRPGQADAGQQDGVQRQGRSLRREAAAAPHQPGGCAHACVHGRPGAAQLHMRLPAPRQLPWQALLLHLPPAKQLLSEITEACAWPCAAGAALIQVRLAQVV
jgi:hypothetical protein